MRLQRSLIQPVACHGDRSAVCLQIIVAVVLFIIVAEDLLVFLHDAVIAEEIQLAADHLPVGLHNAVVVEVIFLSVYSLPAFRHFSLTVQIVCIIVQPHRRAPASQSA